MVLRRFSRIALVGAFGAAALVSAQSPSDIPRWCGKPYKPGYPNQDPGGELYPPPPSPSPLLNVRVASRHSIYVSSETGGNFIVDAAFSNSSGEPYRNATGDGDTLVFNIRLEGLDQPLVANASVAVGSTGALFPFNLSSLAPQMDAYSIVLEGACAGGNQSYNATADLFYLPDKQNGSVTKVDNLHGGLLFRNNATQGKFQPIFPHGFYTNYGDYLEKSKENVKAYADLGFQMIHPIGGYDDNITSVLAYMDELNLLCQYDMRGTYQNLSSVASQVDAAKDFSSLLLWYTADEPDGAFDPLNATRLAYDTISARDKYHPVSLVLNCANFHFDEYTRDATDILMTDPYPIGINATFSKWGTACNSTYGDCGCDDCVGELFDVSNRLDAFADYQTWLKNAPTKPTWMVPQSFSGEGYWSHDPSPGEVWAMNSLAINHGAKGIVSWTFPAPEQLAAAHAAQAAILIRDPVLSFLIGGQPAPIHLSNAPLVDVAVWHVGEQALVSVVSADYNDAPAGLSIDLPFAATSIVSTLWGNVTWTLGSSSAGGKGGQGGASLNTAGLPGLATSLIILNTSGS